VLDAAAVVIDVDPAADVAPSPYSGIGSPSSRLAANSGMTFSGY
jgi:hypothetical protein